MRLSVTGLSHRTAPIALRERFAFAPDDLPAALAVLRRSFPAAAIVSTCNRTELYLVSDRLVEAGEGAAALANARGVELPEGRPFYHHTDVFVARHLFRVAAGLESLVLGESEVLGQVRTAFAAATRARSSDPVLARLFHAAVRVGRRARSETRIGAGALSVSAGAVAISRRAVGDLPRKTALVIGAGEAGEVASQAFLGAGVRRLLVSNRDGQRAEALARDLGAVAVPFEDLTNALAEADVVVSSTAAPSFVLTRSHVESAMANRPGRRLLIVDIAVPRDVDPAVADVPGVRLFDIDAVETVVTENQRSRAGEVAAVEAIVEAEVSRFESWLRGLEVAPTIAAVQQRAEDARLVELEKTLGRLSGLSEADRRRVEAMSRAIVKRILDSPVRKLREEPAAERIAAARALFDLDEE